MVSATAYSQSFVDGLSLSNGHVLNSRHLSGTLIKNTGLRTHGCMYIQLV